jgi:hypothetical protein
MSINSCYNRSQRMIRKSRPRWSPMNQLLIELSVLLKGGIRSTCRPHARNLQVRDDLLTCAGAALLVTDQAGELSCIGTLKVRHSHSPARCETFMHWTIQKCVQSGYRTRHVYVYCCVTAAEDRERQWLTSSGRARAGLGLRPRPSSRAVSRRLSTCSFSGCPLILIVQCKNSMLRLGNILR